MGQLGFTAAHADMHLSWNTCLSEHGSTITISSSRMFWKQIEHGDPSDFWIMSTVAGIAWGSAAYRLPSLQKQAYRQMMKHSSGSSAMKIRQMNTWIWMRNYETRNKDITIISPVFISLTVARITIPYMKSANDMTLPIEMVHRFRGSRERAKFFITLASTGSIICWMAGVTSSIVMLFWILYTLPLTASTGFAYSCSPMRSDTASSSTTWLSSMAMEMMVAGSPSLQNRWDSLATRFMKVMHEAVIKNDSTSSLECLNTQMSRGIITIIATNCTTWRTICRTKLLFAELSPLAKQMSSRVFVILTSMFMSVLILSQSYQFKLLSYPLMKQGRTKKFKAHRKSNPSNPKPKSKIRKISEPRNKLNFGQTHNEPKRGESTKRSWQKPEERPKTKKQLNMELASERKSSDNLMRIIITEQIGKQSPDVNRIKSSLAKLKSRGIKQRLRKKAAAAGILLT